MTSPRFKLTAAFELRSQFKRPLIWVLALLACFMAYGWTAGINNVDAGSGTTGLKTFLNSEFTLAQQLSMTVPIIFAFFVSVAAGMVVISDDESKIGAILHATPLKAGEYLWGKFTGVMVAMGMIALLYTLTAMVFYHGVPNAEYEAFFGPFKLVAYLRPLLFIAFPSLIFVGGLSFAIGERTRKPAHVFILPVVVMFSCFFFLWSWSPVWLSPSANRILMCLDPSGYRWITETWFKVDRGAGFYNQASMHYDLPFLLSRLGLVVIGLAAVAKTLPSFEKNLRGARPTAKETKAALKGTATAVPAAAFKPLSDLGMSHWRSNVLVETWTVARFELKGLLSKPGTYLFVPIILLNVVAQSLTSVGTYDAPLLVTSGLFALNSFGRLTTLICLLLIFFLVESLHRDQASHLEGITSSTPMRTVSALSGKALANALLGVLVIALCGLFGSLAILAQGLAPVELKPLVVLYGLLMVPTLLLWVSFLTAVYSLSRSRMATYALGMAALVATGLCLNLKWVTWATNWPLWDCLLWTDLGTLQWDRDAIILNRLAALATAVFFMACAVKFSGRRERDAAATQLQLRPKAVFASCLGMLPFAALPILLIGVLSVKVGAGYQGDAAKQKAKNYWRRNVETYKGYPLATLTDVDLDLDLNPAERTFAFKGEFNVRNDQAFPLVKLPFTVRQHLRNVTWTVEGQPFLPEDRAGLHVLTIHGKPLAVGATAKIGFSGQGTINPGSSRNGGATMDFLQASGLHLNWGSMAPTLGFNGSIGIDKTNRAESKEFSESWYDGKTSTEDHLDLPFNTRLRISGPDTYQFNSVGTKTEEVVQDGRRHVRFVSDQPVGDFDVIGGRWQVQQGQGTAIYYHPSHAYNVKEMSEALDAARKYYGEWFHPYPWKELKLSEMPGYSEYAQANTTNIAFSESIGFLVRSDPKANTAFLMAAHEAAHQWWGGMVSPGDGPGSMVLNEGLSHFSTALLFEQVKGAEQRKNFLKNVEVEYTRDRQVDQEKPLTQVYGITATNRVSGYNRGAWAFYMLRELMGAEACHAGLAEIVKTYYGNTDHPALQDFLTILRKHAADPQAFDAFVQQWFFQTVLPEYRISEAKRTQRADGLWDVSFRIHNAGTGRMPLIVAVTGATADETPGAKAKELRAACTLASGESKVLHLTSSFKPELLVPDPDVKVMQLRRNVASAKF